MLFNTAQFAIFFGVVLAIARSVPREARLAVLLAASLLFYGLWIPAYLLLLLAEIGVNYALLRAMSRSARPRVYLVASIAFTLGLLAFFKYAALIVETAAPVLAFATGVRPPLPDIFLPLGISFYSFQIIGLAVDTYRGHIEPVRSLRRYALFVSFFPQLVAGPILRGSELLPQLEGGGQTSPERTRRGLWLIASGVAKKMVLADFLLAPFVDSVFDSAGVGSGPYHLLAVYSFAFQIYFDFSGYTDMARGMACLLGFELPLNFREPYLSRNPAEFWRRWHMTLSQWLRDYLYIPLGGNRMGRRRTTVNLGITMLLGGLWHGAAWNFVAWGGLHGLLLMAHRGFARRGVDADAPLSWRDAPRILLMFHACCLAWVFFRAPGFAEAASFIHALVTGSYLVAWPLLPTAIVLLCAALHGLERYVRPRLPRLQLALREPWWGAAVEGTAFGLLFGLVVTVAGAGGEFIYFQF
jgi:D-alanyl-lipoteichoic acid acyltransferase DltB (MBOAT superfamily)